MKHQRKKCYMFFNAQHKMLELNTNDRVLLDYMCERMDSQNLITLDEEEKDRFQDFILHITSGKKSFTPSQVKSSINKLCAIELIFRIRRGLYVVSPKHFANGSLKQNRENFNRLQRALEDKTEDKTLIGLPRYLTDKKEKTA